jgi:hemin uptake protein HemP
MAYSMAAAIPLARISAKAEFMSPMRPLLLLAVAGLTATAPGAARGLQHLREQDAAYRATQQGQILPLPVIRSRIRVRGGEFIGAEFDGRIYRLKYMRGGEVIFVDVDARTGRPIGR